MAVTQPIINEAFVSDTQLNTLQGYREWDIISPAYIGGGSYMWFRGGFFTLNGVEDGYLYTKVGFAMKNNPLILDPNGFLTPVFMGGQWTASYVVMKGGRPIRVDIYDFSYLDTWNQLITSYVNTVTPG